MKFPRSLRIAGREWCLRFLPKKQMEGNLGLCHFEPGTIDIQARLDGFTKRDVVLHETFHAILARQGREYGEDVEELYVNALATGLIGVLQDNPDFAKWLIEPIPK